MTFTCPLVRENPIEQALFEEKPTKYKHFDEIINLDRESMMQKVIIEAMEYWEFYENVNVEH